MGHELHDCNDEDQGVHLFEFYRIFIKSIINLKSIVLQTIKLPVDVIMLLPYPQCDCLCMCGQLGFDPKTILRNQISRLLHTKTRSVYLPLVCNE